ncbi:MAG TPA: PEGA domain-containing protein [Candidatus Binataceae bacterium]|nr:PEGA domain-containing protein [Candidatus Binataceae bacterium]
MRLTMRLSALLMIGAVASSGCATMLKGTEEQIMVSSDPAGADVDINGQRSGKTPYVANVKSSEDLHIRVSKDGYQPDEVSDPATFRSGYELWSFLCYVIPLVVDLSDGAAWGHDQTMVAVHLEPTSHAVAQAQTSPPTTLTAQAQTHAPVTQAQPSPASSPAAPSWGNLHQR